MSLATAEPPSRPRTTGQQAQCTVRVGLYQRRPEFGEDELLNSYVASQPGWQVRLHCTDHYASGATMRRPGLQRVLKAARSGEIDVLVVCHIHNLSRSHAAPHPTSQRTEKPKCPRRLSHQSFLRHGDPVRHSPRVRAGSSLRASSGTASSKTAGPCGARHPPRELHSPRGRYRRHRSADGDHAAYALVHSACPTARCPMTRTHPGANDWRRHGVNFGAQLPSHDTQLGTRAVIYPHVSASQPAVTDRSLAAQREACLRTAAELGFSLIDELRRPGPAGPEGGPARGIPALTDPGPQAIDGSRPAHIDQPPISPAGPRSPMAVYLVQAQPTRRFHDQRLCRLR